MKVYQIQVLTDNVWAPLSCMVRKDKAEAEAILSDIQADNAKLDESIRNELRIEELMLG